MLVFDCLKARGPSRFKALPAEQLDDNMDRRFDRGGAPGVRDEDKPILNTAKNLLGARP